MKKVIVFALLFSVLTAGAFAQLTFSGTAYVGIQLEIPYDTREDEIINAHHRTEGLPLFNLVATINRPNHGLRLNTNFRVDDEAVSVEGIYGWVYFLENSLRLTMGRISSPAWIANLDPDNAFYFDKITGFRLEYDTPLPGLTVGAAFRTEGTNLEQVFKRVIFGANYIHPLFNAVFAYNMGSNAHLLFGLNFTGIPDLTAGIQARVMHLASWDDPGFGGVLELKQRVTYRIMRPLTVSLLMGQTIFAEPRGDWKRRDAELFFTPGVSYTISPGLIASFSTEFRSSDFFDRSRYITLNPSIQYMLGGAALYAEYELRLARYWHDSFHRISFGVTITVF